MTDVFKLFLASILVALITAGRAEDATLFIPLPSGALAGGVSASGSIVGGSLRTGGAFYWMPTTGAIYIGGAGSASVSRDGRTIVGIENDARTLQQAAIWQRATEWRLLGSIAPNAAPCDNLLSSAIGTSTDGKVIVGLAWNGCSIARAFRWEESTGMVDLGSTVANRSSRADDVSGDGKVVVGFQELSTGFWQGARWVDGKQELFVGPSGFIVGQAFATNANGSIVVGQVCNPASEFDQSAWIWTARDGVQCLPPPRVRPGFFLGKATATSDDGRVVGGGQSFGLESEAVLWIDRSPIYLKDFLEQHGVPNAFEGWVNTGTVTGISADGRVVVGFGAGPRDFQGYVVILGSGAKP
jgi:probable HAF family extracellular repeat protein